MLLVHQTGSVKVGEVVRYTVTYTPSLDRILPAPTTLHLKIKNASAIALRAAYLHGPYTLHVAAYPSTFSPNRTSTNPERDGVPEYEPQLKAGGSWNATLNVPDDIRTDNEGASFSWVIEISSQIIFSTSAAVSYEVLIGRDAKSIELGHAKPTEAGQPDIGHVEDRHQAQGKKQGHHAAQRKGVYSKAINLVVEDTESIWNHPKLPQWPVKEATSKAKSSLDGTHNADAIEKQPSRFSLSRRRSDKGEHNDASAKKQQRVHLVVLTHGLHSNIGADMLYLKESIDEAAQQAREDARKRRARLRKQDRQGAGPANDAPQSPSASPADVPTTPDDHGNEVESAEDEEQVIVRGFADNAIKTEKGIKYLGKRLAKYVLSLATPQHDTIASKGASDKTSPSITPSSTGSISEMPAGPRPDQNKHIDGQQRLAYRITSISFIGHSLGGLVQTYAVAYIQKHSPHFFDEIEPINFVALATPFLGLSNENPLYVKFALDFGLVGRTGQDLGLTWRPPTIARSGWGAIVGGLGSNANKAAHVRQDPGSKPLLRILPIGPAHRALKKFRNRTVYSNVVNDGIVPLRTSCLLFLDWSGLGRVEKARRENGLVGTVAEWGWAELTGAPRTSRRDRSPYSPGTRSQESADEGTNTPTRQGEGATVPQPPESATKDDTVNTIEHSPDRHQFLDQKAPVKPAESTGDEGVNVRAPTETSGPLNNLLNLFRPKPSQQQAPRKSSKAYRRGQTVRTDSSPDSRNPNASSSPSVSDLSSLPAEKRRGLVRGDSMLSDPNNPLAPPRTTFFESAGDILNPPLPPTEFLIDPDSRPQTIFHDRVYHPDDIPQAPVRRRTGLLSSSSGSLEGGADGPQSGDNTRPESGVKVEEKIARAYHRDLSWRKVLVRLEPDSHNNIIVRRKFANAYGWPVIKHLVDTHFADSGPAAMRDDEEAEQERARTLASRAAADDDTKGRVAPHHQRTQSELKEAGDGLGDLGPHATRPTGFGGRGSLMRKDSVQWTDAALDVTDDEDEVTSPGEMKRNPFEGVAAPTASSKDGDEEEDVRSGKDGSTPTGTSDAEIADFLTSSRSKSSGALVVTDIAASSSPKSVQGEATQLGLPKALKRSDGSAEKEDGRASGETGVVEQVARLSTSSGS
ncbi:MAG: hypothetical protein M1817_002702 [Caeruleum heppii]|nr:MAG: hypothetical protein M1817_002702 [Caeruleum heppii]